MRIFTKSEKRGKLIISQIIREGYDMGSTIVGTVIGKGRIQAPEEQHLSVMIDRKCTDYKESIKLLGSNGFVGYPSPEMYMFIEEAEESGRRCEGTVICRTEENTYRVLLCVCNL